MYFGRIYIQQTPNNVCQTAAVIIKNKLSLMFVPGFIHTPMFVPGHISAHFVLFDKPKFTYLTTVPYIELPQISETT